jgi:N-acylneuraminate cytidylyltransferase
MATITAVIPARAGSQRLKDKNISRFAGTNLLLHKIEQLRRVSLIDNIVVSSDSDIMLEMATATGAKTQKRPLEYCDEKTKSFGDVVEWVVSNLEGEHILWATCTSPLTDSADYQSAIEKYFEVLGEYDSLVSFEVLKRFVWDEEKPINYTTGKGHVTSQNLPVLYTKTCGISIAPRSDMMRWKYDHGEHPYKFILEKRTSVDIDDIYDLFCARAWLDL